MIFIMIQDPCAVIQIHLEPVFSKIREQPYQYIVRTENTCRDPVRFIKNIA